MITENCAELIHFLCILETNDPKTKEWRKYLTDEERELVRLWEDEWEAGITRTCADGIWPKGYEAKRSKP